MFGDVHLGFVGECLKLIGLIKITEIRKQIVACNLPTIKIISENYPKSKLLYLPQLIIHLLYTGQLAEISRVPWTSIQRVLKTDTIYHYRIQLLNNLNEDDPTRRYFLTDNVLPIINVSFSLTEWVINITKCYWSNFNLHILVVCQTV